MDTTGMGTRKCLQKLWCGTIRGCGTIKIISRNKDKTLWIVPQCGTIQGCSTNRVNMVYWNSLVDNFTKLCTHLLCNLNFVDKVAFICSIVPRYNVSIFSAPPVHGNANILELTVGSAVTLRCMVTPTPPSDSEFSWSCNGCSLESVHFQFVTINEVEMSYSGEINCSVITEHEKYTSEPIELRVLGKYDM